LALGLREITLGYQRMTLETMDQTGKRTLLEASSRRS
jgi:hypothetical protein